MDLNEHALTEAQRTLKRLGVTHVLASGDLTRTQEAPLQPLDTPTLRPASELSAQDTSRQQAPPPSETPLPHLLRSLFHGKHTPVRTMWTYAGLHRDLQEPENPARLIVFKKIQESVCQHLKWDPERLCSWPLDLDPSSFKKGLEHFRPNTVIVFRCHESQAGAEQTSNLQAMELAGLRMVTLPDLEAMARGDQQLKNEAWRVLQTLHG